MTAVVGENMGPTGQAKNCNGWADYEAPLVSEFANLCNGGSYGDYRWQACPSRLDCRVSTEKEKKKTSGQGSGIQVLGSTSRLGWGNRTTLPVQKEQAPEPATVRIAVHDEEYPYLQTPRLETKSVYRPSPVFLPVQGESLFTRGAKNVGQAIIHAFLQQLMELAQNVDFWPSRRKSDE